MDETFLRYSALDSACMMEIHKDIWPDVEMDFRFTNDMTMDILPVLMFMQTRGVKVDHVKLEETKKEVIKAKEEKQKELDEIVGSHLNVDSPKQVAHYFYDIKGVGPYRNGKSITTDDKALQKIVRGTVKQPGLKEARLVQDIRGLGKLFGTYLDLEFDADSRLRCSYNPRGTKFGRLSSSQTVFGTGTNMQNLPPEFKKFVVADDGYVFVEVDKRQAEWVVVAYSSGDANMISAIEQGVDVHVHTASLMFNCEHEIVEYENKVIGHETSADMIEALRKGDPLLAKFCHNFPRVMSGRQCGKKSNHGLNYDEGFVGFSTINEMDQREGKRIHSLYHEIYPGIKLWYEAIKRTLQRDNRTLTNCFGRKVRFLGQWGDDLWKSAYSMIPQSTVVDSLNKGLVQIYNDNWLCGQDKCNIDILAQVHDSILMQVPIAIAQNEAKFNEVLKSITEYTSPDITYHGRTFKIASDYKVGRNWGGFNKNTNTDGMREYKSYDDIKVLWEN